MLVRRQRRSEAPALPAGVSAGPDRAISGVRLCDGNDTSAVRGEPGEGKQWTMAYRGSR